MDIENLQHENAFNDTFLFILYISSVLVSAYIMTKYF